MRMTDAQMYARVLASDADYDGLGLAVNQGSAAEHFGLAPDDPVRIEPA